MMIEIKHGLIDPLMEIGIGPSAGIVFEDGRRLYAVFSSQRRQVMIVWEPEGEIIVGLPLTEWNSSFIPKTGDLLDELIDWKNAPRLFEALEMLDDREV